MSAESVAFSNAAGWYVLRRRQPAQSDSFVVFGPEPTAGWHTGSLDQARRYIARQLRTPKRTGKPRSRRPKRETRQLSLPLNPSQSG